MRERRRLQLDEKPFHLSEEGFDSRIRQVAKGSPDETTIESDELANLDDGGLQKPSRSSIRRGEQNLAWRKRGGNDRRDGRDKTVISHLMVPF